MARSEKLLTAFIACSGPFSWRDFVKVIDHLGYREVSLKGRTRGSRRRFAHSETGHVLIADAPHDGEMGLSMVKRLRRDLEEAGVI
ncbi:MAG: type II toxin-antitoxin system HicA family toxin [Methyloceanibacter sp.]